MSSNGGTIKGTSSVLTAVLKFICIENLGQLVLVDNAVVQLLLIIDGLKSFSIGFHL